MIVASSVVDASWLKPNDMQKTQFKSPENCHRRLREGCRTLTLWLIRALAELRSLSRYATLLPSAHKPSLHKFQVKGYTDLAEMLKREKVDVLSICTQHTQHPAAVEIAAACRCACHLGKASGPSISPLATGPSQPLGLLESN